MNSQKKIAQKTLTYLFNKGFFYEEGHAPDLKLLKKLTKIHFYDCNLGGRIITERTESEICTIGRNLYLWGAALGVKKVNVAPEERNVYLAAHKVMEMKTPWQEPSYLITVDYTLHSHNHFQMGLNEYCVKVYPLSLEMIKTITAKN